MYRKEHPKPQFMRENWLNLNGKWQFEIDYSDSGKSKGFYKNNQKFSKEIEVPFCPESKLSGIELKDFMNAVWYKREVEFTKEQLNGRVILHFGAVDYLTTVYVNEVEAGVHKGGMVSFSFDITEYVHEGKNVICVQAQDDCRNPMTPSGKQSGKYDSYECYYTRTTGIWQTVWVEFVPKNYIVKAKYTTEVENAIVNVQATVKGQGLLNAEVYYEGRNVGSANVWCNGGITHFSITLSEKHLWEVGNGRLYDIIFTFGEDRVKSYFGLRSLRLDGYKFLINERSVFQRLILDQGYYPDGIYTASSDEELEADIDRALAMGFNGARLHEKIFEERYLYYCDKKGYIVWGEFPNWGLDHSYPEAIFGILPEWMEEVERDFNHPAIVGWCPLNETWDVNGRAQCDDVIKTVYLATKAIDPTRPCIDTSGNFHVMTDIFDVHDYEQNVEEFRSHYERVTEGILEDSIYRNIYIRARQSYDGKSPTFVSEYGGIALCENEEGWGYGIGPRTREEFLERLKGLTDALLDNPYMFGLCYTQLTDVEQEQNGLYTYNRKAKFEPEIIKNIFSRKAAIET